MAPFYPFHPYYVNVTETTIISEPCPVSLTNTTYTTPPAQAANSTITASLPPPDTNHADLAFIGAVSAIVGLILLGLALRIWCFCRSMKPKEARRERDIEAARQHVAEAYATMNEPLPVDHPYWSGREEREIRRLRDEMARVASPGR